MSRRSRPPQPAPDRRVRRAAEREQRHDARGAVRRPAGRGSGGRRGSPVLLITIGAVVVGALIIGFAILQNQAPPVIAAPTVTTPPALAHDRQLGSSSAPVTLVVWSDFQCPVCRIFWTASEPQIAATYIATGKVRLVYRDRLVIGPESLDAAVAARCADRQGKFWTYHDYLYANQGAENSGAFSRSRLIAIAAAIDLDTSSFTSCLSDPSVAQAVQQENAAGVAAGVNGTPTLFVNGTLVGSYDFPTVAKAINAALAAKGSPAPSATATSSP